MRDQIIEAFVQILAAEQPPDRVTPIVVALIAMVGAIGTALLAVFARKPAPDSGSAGLVTQLREDVRVRDRRIERRDREIDRLQGICWQHGINPLDGSKVTPQ